MLAHLLNQSARLWPDKAAVTDGGRSITYSELDSLSDRMAAALTRLAQRGMRVAFFLPKSVEAVVAMFGALKAGMPYVPLDARAPLSRLAFMLQDCGAKVLVTSRSSRWEDLLAMAGTGQQLAVVVSEEIGAEHPAPAPVFPIDEDIAYILYTSGSTGQPKGVMITHRNALTFIDWAHEYFGVNHQDRLANHASLHFDLSVLDIFVAIKAGATVVLIPEFYNALPHRLTELVAQARITLWYSVPGALIRMLEQGRLKERDLSSIRAVLFAGEVFSTAKLRQLMLALPGARFYNLFGPTETNVFACYHVPAPPPPNQTEPVSIGSPCANTEVVLVNEQGQVVTAMGEVGEMWVRGSIVAKGYWGRPDLTDRVFVPDPFHTEYPGRMCRTGDLAEWQPGGTLRFHGRRDHMVKVRGYRVELGEIEAVLQAHPAVGEAVVVAIPHTAVGAELYAFVTLDPEAVPPDLLQYCALRLPHYMVPTAVAHEPMLPRTSTGKADRVALQLAAATDTSEG
jgi:amino acid adenylation domain-containing protein